MGRGRFGTFDLVVLAGLSPPSFIAGAEGEGATMRLGWADTKTSIYVTDYTILHVFCMYVYLCVHLWSRRVVHLRFKDL